MREIKFRGKASKDWNDNFHQQKFIYGSLILCEDEITSTIINREFEAQVDTDTIGQFTGLLDKNGKEIYEGDIIARTTIQDRYVIFKDGGFQTVSINHFFFFVQNNISCQSGTFLSFSICSCSCLRISAFSNSALSSNLSKISSADSRSILVSYIQAKGLLEMISFLSTSVNGHILDSGGLIRVFSTT